MQYVRIGLLTSILGLIVAIALFPFSAPLLRWARTITRGVPASPLSSTSTIATSKVHSKLYSTSTMPRTPVYFLSHGGPNIMEDYSHPAYSKLQEIGKEITQKVKPRAVVVFSAHWQASPNTIEVNTAELTDLIYDYYGFPDHYYKIKYPNIGSKDIASCVLTALKTANIDAKGVSRGLDHGVFAPFTVAFDPKTNPLNVPLVQVSLFDSDDANQHYRLGEAMQGLREEGILVIVSGMAVHNLRDMWKAMQQPAPMPYSISFDAALKEAVEQKPENRQKAMADLLRRSDARRAHPSFEHLLPIHIGAGAAGDDNGKQLWTLPQGSMSWAQFRFGEVDNVTA
ncbi:aromatic ring-opening dioxygenase LigB subunit, partial [Aureobasidium melanogenum]